MSNKSLSGTIGTIISIVLSVAALGFTGWVILNRQYVFDQFNVWWYKPSSAVATITERSGMSSEGKFYFYTSQPAIEGANDFNNNCVRQEAGSAILGCYTNQNIYIYDVTNAELDGVEEVTAAHETLHAIWERMSSSDKQSVGSLLETAFAKINDPKLNERMAYYDRTEPGERKNELHSILGTEYSNLGDELEARYDKYFSDRSKVVALHNNYEQVFDDLKLQSDALAVEIAALKKTIDSQIVQYNTEAASISSDVTKLKKDANSVDRTSATQVNAYNARRQALLDRIDVLDELRVTINAQTDTYNAKVVEYNKLVVTTNNLNKSLDSTLSPAPSL